MNATKRKVLDKFLLALAQLFYGMPVFKGSPHVSATLHNEAGEILEYWMFYPASDLPVHVANHHISSEHPEFTNFRWVVIRHDLETCQNKYSAGPSWCIRQVYNDLKKYGRDVSVISSNYKDDEQPWKLKYRVFLEKLKLTTGNRSVKPKGNR